MLLHSSKARPSGARTGAADVWRWVRGGLAEDVLWGVSNGPPKWLVAASSFLNSFAVYIMIEGCLPGFNKQPALNCDFIDRPPVSLCTLDRCPGAFLEPLQALDGLQHPKGTMGALSQF